MTNPLTPERHVGPTLTCTVCHRRKRPVGRSVPLEMEQHLCGGLGPDYREECPGYRMDPHPSSLWPGEESDVMS
jgi:hypothetical protein